VSLIDKVMGRLKQAAGDIADDPQLRREGVLDERKGEVKEELHDSQREVERKAAEVADLERRTAASSEPRTGTAGAPPAGAPATGAPPTGTAGS
jgi:uncharacterized protein YjbJ (UPF0337 family)